MVILIKVNENELEKCSFVFDRSSRNNRIYDSTHIVNCVNNPTQFYRSLTGSSRYGEWGHPITVDKVLEVEFKPTRTNGKYFEEALDEEAFFESIRHKAKPVAGLIV